MRIDRDQIQFREERNLVKRKSYFESMFQQERNLVKRFEIESMTQWLREI